MRSGAGIRRIALAVALGAILVPHWLSPLRTRSDQPVLFVAGLTAAVVLVALWAAAADRSPPE